jgi:hypothetical protein
MELYPKIKATFIYESKLINYLLSKKDAHNCSG